LECEPNEVEMNIHRNTLIACGIAAAFAVVAVNPATAAPVVHAGSVLKQASGDSLVAVSERARRDGRRAVRRAAPPPGYDNVGSIVYDGIGYGYNRRTGERYMTCMVDEGYGRVSTCDSVHGGGGGGRD
jgi:hypothetical protein